MKVEEKLIISVLKLSKDGPILIEIVKNDLQLPKTTLERLLQTLHKEGLLYLQDEFVETSVLQRVGLALRAIQLGADYELVSRFLSWKEFERLAAAAFDMNNYTTTLNFRFKQGGRRWEMDVVGFRRPLVVCVDCKHWRRGLYSSQLKKIVGEQIRRTVALSELAPSRKLKFESTSWEKATFIPVVVSLLPSSSRFYDRVPIVPVLQLRDFLCQLPMCSEPLKKIEASATSQD